MGVVGIGVDIVTISRVNKLWSRFGKRYLNKYLSVGEQNDFETIDLNRKAEFLAGRYVSLPFAYWV